MVSQKEIIEALRFVNTPYTESLANRIDSEGMAPPDGMVAAPGMDLRDYFAAKALQGFMSSVAVSWSTPPSGFAADAYKMADAMLKARGEA